MFRITNVISSSRLSFKWMVGMLLMALVALLSGQDVSAAANQNRLYPGEFIQQNQALISPNGQYEFRMQSDGNLVHYVRNTHTAYKVLWATQSSGSGHYLVMQDDGNAVLYNQSHQVFWNSGTGGNSGAYLELQDDGNVVVYSKYGVRLNDLSIVNSSLRSDERLYPGWYIQSPDRRFRMLMQTDGNLVVYERNSDGVNETPRWHSCTNNGDSGSWARMQGDGNLVVYKTGGVSSWSSGTNNSWGATLSGKTDGSFRIHYNGSDIWNSKTAPICGVPQGGTTGLIGGSDRYLAQKILSSGKVTGDSRYINQIKAYAAGNYSCHINPTILSLVYTIVAPGSEGGLNHRVYISSLNRYCTGVLTSSGTSSYHYRSSGGHAVDFAIVDGMKSTGSTSNDIRLLKEILPLLPSGSGIGQSNCRTGSNVLTMPSGVTQFSDTCNHIHIQVPVR